MLWNITHPEMKVSWVSSFLRGNGKRILKVFSALFYARQCPLNSGLMMFISVYRSLRYPSSTLKTPISTNVMLYNTYQF